jgi:roadblock/LC7 domain-containing protein
VATIEEILRVKGVVVAGEFTPTGEVVAYRATIYVSRQWAEMMAELCARLTGMLATLSDEYTSQPQMGWMSPTRGWSYSGNGWTLVIGGQKGACVETAQCDFTRLFELLLGEQPGAPGG